MMFFAGFYFLVDDGSLLRLQLSDFVLVHEVPGRLPVALETVHNNNAFLVFPRVEIGLSPKLMITHVRILRPIYVTP